MGAPKANVNGMKTGKHVAIARLTVGEFPRELLSVRREARAYRRAIEAAVVEARGKVSKLDSHFIDTASAATASCAVFRWLLRRRFGTLSTSDVRGLMESLLKAKQIRDNAIRQLKLDRDQEDEIEALYTPRPDESELASK
jgi:hypothetical protein